MSVIRLQYLLKLKSSASFHKRALKMEKSAIKNCYISVRGTIKGPVKHIYFEFSTKMSWELSKIYYKLVKISVVFPKLRTYGTIKLHFFGFPPIFVYYVCAALGRCDLSLSSPIVNGVTQMTQTIFP